MITSIRKNYTSVHALNPYGGSGKFGPYKMMQKIEKMTETLAYGYSADCHLRELSNQYKHYRVKMDFKNLCICVLWTKVASALEGLINIRD